MTESDLDRWVAAQGWSRDDLARLIEEDALAARVVTIQEADLDRHLADELRLRGAYGELAARAGQKHELLAAQGLDDPSCAALGISEEDLWRWFFAEVLGAPGPSAPEEVAGTLGLSSVEALRRLALRELGFVRLQANST